SSGAAATGTGRRSSPVPTAARLMPALLALSLRLALPLRHALPLRQACLERGQQIHHLAAAALRLGLDGDLAALGLLLDQLQHGLAKGVLVLRRIPLAAQRVDDLQR